MRPQCNILILVTSQELEVFREARCTWDNAAGRRVVFADTGVPAEDLQWAHDVFHIDGLDRRTVFFHMVSRACLLRDLTVIGGARCMLARTPWPASGELLGSGIVRGVDNNNYLHPPYAALQEEWKYLRLGLKHLGWPDKPFLSDNMGAALSIASRFSESLLKADGFSSSIGDPAPFISAAKHGSLLLPPNDLPTVKTIAQYLQCKPT